MTEQAYAELQTRSYFSFLDGASSPGQLAQCAAAMHLAALALTDTFSVAGWPRFQTACAAHNLKPIAGARVLIANSRHQDTGTHKNQNDPAAFWLTLLVENAAGWHNLCRLLSLAHGGLDEVPDEDWTGKLDPALTLDLLLAHSEGLLCINPSRMGAREAALQQLAHALPGRLWQALTDHRRVDDNAINIAAAQAAGEAGIPLVVTGDVAHHTHALGRLRDALLAIDQRMTLSEARAAGVLPPNHQAFMRDGATQWQRFAGLEDAVAESVRIANRCNFALNLKDVPPPAFPTPPGIDAHMHLVNRCWRGFDERYDAGDNEARARLTHELEIIQQAGLSEYFLHAAALCEYAERNGIKHSGRGSAAGAMISYCLDISQLCPLQFGLSFERFINPQRSSPIDIDLDFDSARRDEVIRHALGVHGREHAALVSVNIEFSTRLAMRELARVLEIPIDTAARYAQLHDRSSPTGAADAIDLELDEAGVPRPSAGSEQGSRHPLRLFCQLLRDIGGVPRHRGQHPGGVVFARRPLCEWMPIERAAMPGRYCVQFDKDDLDDLGMPKLDLLGLRALTLIGQAEQIVSARAGKKLDLNTLPGVNYLPDARTHRYAARSGYTPAEDPVWQQLELADTIGLFQVQSRAQTQLIDKTKPADLMELSIQIAIIRPGPVQGGLMGAYVDRKRGLVNIEYLHPTLEPALKKTLGVPIFQEHLMDLAITLAGFSSADADSMRRAANKKHAAHALEAWRERFLQGCRLNKISEETALKAFDNVRGFAAFGFLLSHSASFARLSYQTLWLKHHHPQAFYVGLLNSNSGFYTHETIAGDIRRHGLRVLPLDARESQWQYAAEGNSGIRIGFETLKHFNRGMFAQLAAARAQVPFASLRDFAARVPMPRDALYELVRAGALDHLGGRRELLWALGEISPAPDALALGHRTTPAPLQPLDALEKLMWDVETTGLSADGNQMHLLQPLYAAQGYASLSEIRTLPDGARVRTAAPPYIFQRPGTANGVCFMGLEYAEGLLDVIIWPKVYEKYRSYIRLSNILKFEGVVQRRGLSISLIFERPA